MKTIISMMTIIFMMTIITMTIITLYTLLSPTCGKASQDSSAQLPSLLVCCLKKRFHNLQSFNI